MPKDLSHIMDVVIVEFANQASVEVGSPLCDELNALLAKLRDTHDSTEVVVYFRWFMAQSSEHAESLGKLFWDWAMKTACNGDPPTRIDEPAREVARVSSGGSPRKLVSL